MIQTNWKMKNKLLLKTWIVYNIKFILNHPKQLSSSKQQFHSTPINNNLTNHLRMRQNFIYNVKQIINSSKKNKKLQMRFIKIICKNNKLSKIINLGV